jgi:hypothetical protein
MGPHGLLQDNFTLTFDTGMYITSFHANEFLVVFVRYTVAITVNEVENAFT